MYDQLKVIQTGLKWQSIAARLTGVIQGICKSDVMPVLHKKILIEMMIKIYEDNEMQEHWVKEWKEEFANVLNPSN